MCDHDWYRASNDSAYLSLKCCVGRRTSCARSPCRRRRAPRHIPPLASRHARPRGRRGALRAAASREAPSASPRSGGPRARSSSRVRRARGASTRTRPLLRLLPLGPLPRRPYLPPPQAFDAGPLHGGRGRRRRAPRCKTILRDVAGSAGPADCSRSWARAEAARRGAQRPRRPAQRSTNDDDLRGADPRRRRVSEDAAPRRARPLAVPLLLRRRPAACSSPASSTPSSPDSEARDRRGRTRLGTSGTRNRSALLASVDLQLRRFGLAKCAETRVGDVKTRGISRRRARDRVVSARELIAASPRPCVATNRRPSLEARPSA